MAPDPILVIDAGTSALRAVLVHPDGEAQTVATVTWPMFVPDDAAGFGREFDAGAVRRALADLLATASQACASVAAIAFTGQREGLVFLAGAEAVLVSPNIDARAASEGLAIDAVHGDAVYRTTGHLPSLMQASAKLRWLQLHRPADAARVDVVLPLADWLASSLTGTAAMSRTLGIENGLLDVAAAAPVGEAEPFGGLARLLAAVVADGTSTGVVRTGVYAGTPVVLAGADTQCALLGLAAVAPGDAAVPAGWSAPVQMALDRPLIDAERRTWTGMHVVAGAWVLESNAGETGRAWAWVRDLLGVTDAEGDALAAAAPPGSNDAMAVIGPRVMRADAMNAGIGALTVPLPLVMSAPSRGDVLRSALEAAAYAIRANVEQLELVSGRSIGTLRLGGGMSQSALVPQMLADVLGRPVEVARAPETTAVGAAVLASVAAQTYGDIAAAVAGMCGGRRVCLPHGRVSAAYDDLYDRWCAMSEQFESGMV